MFFLKLPQLVVEREGVLLLRLLHAAKPLQLFREAGDLAFDPFEHRTKDECTVGALRALESD